MTLPWNFKNNVPCMVAAHCPGFPDVYDTAAPPPFFPRASWSVMDSSSKTSQYLC